MLSYVHIQTDIYMYVHGTVTCMNAIPSMSVHICSLKGQLALGRCAGPAARSIPDMLMVRGQDRTCRFLCFFSSFLFQSPFLDLASSIFGIPSEPVSRICNQRRGSFSLFVLVGNTSPSATLVSRQHAGRAKHIPRS